MDTRRIGLTFDEFVELELKPRADADRPFQEEVERARLFPMKFEDVNTHLLMRGYDCCPQMLETLIEDNRLVKVADPKLWSQADVDAVAEFYEHCEFLTSVAQMCKTMGCSFADFRRPLREAAVRASAQYGRRIPEDTQFFVMHCQPPRDDTPSIITFTLCDDVREHIESGEEV